MPANDSNYFSILAIIKNTVFFKCTKCRPINIISLEKVSASTRIDPLRRLRKATDRPTVKSNMTESYTRCLVQFISQENLWKHAKDTETLPTNHSIITRNSFALDNHGWGPLCRRARAPTDYKTALPLYSVSAVADPASRGHALGAQIPSWLMWLHMSCVQADIWLFTDI